jgi:GNAT superfamily N-acetyltransferase
MEPRRRRALPILSTMNRETRDVEIVRAESAAQWDAARRLVEEYAASLRIDLSFQNYQQEIATLTKEYGPPRGCFALARSSGADVGCGGFRARGDTTCEMKRLYVVPSAQRRGIGLLLAQFLIQQAEAVGYDTMLLDTLPGMTAAHALYASLGFERTEPYRHNPVPGATFWKLSLRPQGTRSAGR